jgi:hypothetical protein
LEKVSIKMLDAQLRPQPTAPRPIRLRKTRVLKYASKPIPPHGRYKREIPARVLLSERSLGHMFPGLTPAQIVQRYKTYHGITPKPRAGTARSVVDPAVLHANYEAIKTRTLARALAHRKNKK